MPAAPKAVATSGAKAIATGSWSVANANGFADGEQVSLALEIDNIADREGDLRAVDWADYETRMFRILRLHYGDSGFGLEPAAIRVG